MVGIGGVGMSALAHALHDRGVEVTGSDINASDRVVELRKLGIPIQIGHDPANVTGADLVVHSTAVRADNPELSTAREHGTPIWHRSQMLAHFLEQKLGIAVAGTHGKTTTTAMLGKILTDTGCDPTIFLGGISLDFSSNYRLGSSDVVVFEADESDASFHQYTDCSQIITNIEPEHLDQHRDFATIRRVFERFVSIGASEGTLVYGADNPALCGIAENFPGDARPFSLTYPGAAYYASVDKSGNGGTDATLYVDGVNCCDLALPMAGKHNTADALAAIGMAHALGVSPAAAAQSLSTFAGTGRRFQRIYRDGSQYIYDDYAHHPTEIRAALSTARLTHPDAHVTAVFQPHLPSRTRFLLDDFARAFGAADTVVITSIFESREDPIPGFTAQTLVDRIAGLAPGSDLHYVDNDEHLPQFMMDRMPTEQVVLFIGAGDINKLSRQLVDRLMAQREQERSQ
jgi:UDP-N-acetylmuramate--alanine ligase